MKNDQNDFIHYIAYRTQLALYEILHEDVPDLSWEEFVELIICFPILRRAASDAALYALATFDPAQFEFTQPTEPDISEQGEGTFTMAELFDARVGRELANLFLLKAAAEQYKRRKEAGDSAGKEAFVRELHTNGSLHAELSYAYGTGLKKADFRGAWLRDGTTQVLAILDSCR